MDVELGFESLTSNLSYLWGDAAEGLESALLKHLRLRGMQPSSLAVDERLRRAATDPNSTIESVRNIAICDPLLCLRLLSLTGTVAYRRDRAINTISAALNVVGIRKVADTNREISEVKNYSAVFLGRSVAATVLQEMMLSVRLAEGLSSLIIQRSDQGEMAYLAAALYESPILAFAFHRPNIFSGCFLDSLIDPKAGFDVQLDRVFAKTKSELALAMADGLGLSDEYKRIMRLCEGGTFRKPISASKGDLKDIIEIAYCVFYASKLAREICRFGGKVALDSLVKEVAQKFGVAKVAVYKEVRKVIDGYVGHCEVLGVHPLRLPSYIPIVEKDDDAPVASPKSIPIAERINSFLYELKACFRSRKTPTEFHRMPQAVLCTLQALVKGAGFSRACLFRYEKDRDLVMPMFIMGQPSEGFALMLRAGASGDSAHMPDFQAVKQLRAVFQGDPLFSDSWPFVAFPVVWKGEVQGVFYADRLSEKENSPLDMQEQVACIALAEGWNPVPDDFI